MRWISVILIFLNPSVWAEEERVPWSSSGFRGLPEHPKPYHAVPVWPDLQFDRVTDIARLPSRELIFLTCQKGKIWILPDDVDLPTPAKRFFADLGVSHPGEFESSFSIAFHPEFESNRQVFVFYRTAAKPDDRGTRISRFTTYPDRLELDPDTEEILLEFRSGGHNGGHLGFGPDGMLYVLTGDSEVPTPPDPLNTGQDISDLLSSVLRIDVNRREGELPYAIPDDNPFVGMDGVRPEIWAYGLRNPWKLCFHPEDGSLWVADVGWELWEMLYRVEKGSNFGWSIVEGPQPIKPNQNSGPSPLSAPSVVHPHTEFASITGGYFYEGDRLPELKGAYLYGDFVTGQLWGLWLDEGNPVDNRYLADTRLQIVTFGQAGGGDVIFMDWPDGQNIYRLEKNTEPDLSGSFPRDLSKTGLFSDAAKQIPESGVYEFSINGPMWQDGATAKRWIAIPGSETIRSAEKRPFSEIPQGTVLVKTIEMEGRRVETQILLFHRGRWEGLTYAWDESQSDAKLVEPGGRVVNIGDVRWAFPSRAECARCHNIGSDFRLAFHPGQLNRDGQLDRFLQLGLIDEGFSEKSKNQETAAYDDETAPADIKARTWLSANCAHCHRNRGGGSVAMHLNLETELDEMDIVNARPVKGDFGILNARIVDPGEPARSVLYYRSVTAGIGHMPMIGAKTVDPEGERLLYDWIVFLDKEDSSGKGDGEKDAASLQTLESALRLQHLIRRGAIQGAEAQSFIDEGRSSPNPMISGLFQSLPDP